MSPRYCNKAALLADFGGRSNNWLKARIKNDSFPPPVYLGGRDGLFDMDAVAAWREAVTREGRRIVVKTPRKAVAS